MATGAATGLTMRHDHGSQYMSDDFHAELRFLGIVSSPAFVRQPEGNGCIERFFRTLKEQLLWVRHRECPTGSRKSAATVNTSYPTFCISAMLSSSRSRCAFSIQRCS